MSRSVTPGTTGYSVEVFIQDSGSIVGAGKTGLVYNTASLVAYYTRDRAVPVQITLATQTVTGAYSSGGFVEIDATNMPGMYRLDVPDAALITGSNGVRIMLKGASGMAPVVLDINLNNEVNLTRANGVAITAEDGTLASATETTVTFAESVPDDTALAWTMLRITGGTGEGQVICLTTRNSERTFDVLAGTMPVQCDNTSKYIVVGAWRSNVNAVTDSLDLATSNAGTLTALGTMLEDDGGIQFTAKAVSQAPTGGSAPTVEEIRTEMDTNSTKLIAILEDTAAIVTPPTAAEVRVEMDSNSTKLGTIETNTTNIPSTTDITDAIQALEIETGVEWSEVMAAIASLMAGTWTRDGNDYTFTAMGNPDTPRVVVTIVSGTGRTAVELP